LDKVKLENEKLHDIMHEVYEELKKAMTFHQSMFDAHQGYAIILEELDEAWLEIKCNDKKRTREEMIQVAAMAIRFLHDVSDKGTS
jgi:hypothetical protein